MSRPRKRKIAGLPAHLRH